MQEDTGHFQTDGKSARYCEVYFGEEFGTQKGAHCCRAETVWVPS